MTAVLAWLLGSRIGRYLAIGGLAAVLVLIVIARIRAGGRNAELLRATQEATRRVLDRIKVDEEIRAMPRARRRERLRQWARD
jgi:hypothetical protein